MKIPSKNLQEQISVFDTCILYTPLSDEVDYADIYFPIKLPQNKIYLPSDKNSDPFELASNLSIKLSNKKVFLLIPGTKFDKFGTRHGRGGGWYDRFLSNVPRSWIRIGVTDISNFSDLKLQKNKWDEEVDYVLIV